MTKFVLMADSSIRFQLQDEHIEWLRKNGYPEADRFFCEEDRSNPVLIQCIEAIRATKQPLIDEAKALYQDYEQKAAPVAVHQANYLSNQDEFLKAFHQVCNPRWKQGRTVVVALRNAMWNDWTWDRFVKERIFEGISEVDLQPLMPFYNTLYQGFVASKPETEMSNIAREKLHNYCAKNGLRMFCSDFTVEDGFKIVSYDETRFTAKVVHSWDYNDGSSEEFQLIPFITRTTIDSFVAKGDTNGLMEYLRSLNSNLNIEA